jgi:hypothetical protein
VKATNQFHVGIVVDDFESALIELSELFGYEWCPEFNGTVPVTLPAGTTSIDLRFAYSRTTPRLEIVRSIPGTVWMPADGSGIHHAGYWSDDVATDSATLERRGYAREAAGTNPDGTAAWAYHRSAAGPRIELVDRRLEPGLEQMWASRRRGSC